MNDASLLAAMETAGRDSDDERIKQQMKGSGIGTPATRAAIIERLLQVGYAKRQGKNLIATEKGIRLIDVVPEQLSSAETTGRWELALDKITRGEQDPARFMDSIRRFSAFLVDYTDSQSPPAQFPAEERCGKGSRKAAAATLKGTACPLCGKPLRESAKGFHCSANSCPFTLWKDTLTRAGGPELTEKLIRLLLERRQLQGSTGTIALTGEQLTFTPNGAQEPTVQRSIRYTKQQGGPRNG